MQVLDENKKEKIGGIEVKIVYGIVIPEKTEYDIRAWQNKATYLKWTIEKEQLGAGEIKLSIEKEKNKKYEKNIDKTINEIDMHSIVNELNNQTNKLEDKYKAFIKCYKDGREIYQTEELKLNIKKNTLYFINNKKKLFERNKRGTFKIKKEDYEQLWESGVKSKQKIQLEIESINKEANISYGNAEIDKKMIDRGVMIIIHGKYNLNLDTDMQPVLILKINGKNEGKIEIKCNLDKGKKIFSAEINDPKEIKKIRNNNNIEAWVVFKKKRELISTKLFVSDTFSMMH